MAPSFTRHTTTVVAARHARTGLVPRDLQSTARRPRAGAALGAGEDGDGSERGAVKPGLIASAFDTVHAKCAHTRARLSTELSKFQFATTDYNATKRRGLH